MHYETYLPDILWASYTPKKGVTYTGPFFRGSDDARFKPSVPEDSFWRRSLDVLLAAESGGRYNAINMYDRCIITTGIVQWCEAANLFGTTRLVGALAEANRALVLEHVHELPGAHVGFRRGPNGWRFYLGSKAVETREDQRLLFLGGATGLKGQWTNEQKDHAKRVAAVFAAMLARPEFAEAHDEHALRYLHAFKLLTWARDKMFLGAFPEDGWDGALRAGFVSFAVNLPGTAVQQLQDRWDELQGLSAKDRCIEGLKQLTFGPKIAIYPTRYNGIRPALERLFGVDLPDFAVELKQFHAENPGARFFPDAKSIQRALLACGYDLGPYQADGSIGPLTREAIREFKRDEDIEPIDSGLSEVFLIRLHQKQQELTA